MSLFFTPWHSPTQSDSSPVLTSKNKVLLTYSEWGSKTQNRTEYEGRSSRANILYIRKMNSSRRIPSYSILPDQQPIDSRNILLTLCNSQALSLGSSAILCFLTWDSSMFLCIKKRTSWTSNVYPFKIVLGSYKIMYSLKTKSKGHFCTILNGVQKKKKKKTVTHPQRHIKMIYLQNVTLFELRKTKNTYMHFRDFEFFFEFCILMVCQLIS